jgi:hypothetical protein
VTMLALQVKLKLGTSLGRRLGSRLVREIFLGNGTVALSLLFGN